MIIAKIIAFLPMKSSWRGGIYKLFNRMTIGHNFKMGFGSYIDANEIVIGDNAVIGNLVRIKLLDRFFMGNDCSIGSSTIICGSYVANKFAERDFVCGDNVRILSSHYFDVVAPITIGNFVTIAGKWTQFYTHSFDLVPNRMDGGISIGNRCYIGAGCLINLGVNICDNVVLQGGTCVNKSITEPGVYASQSFYRRGDVRQYNAIAAGCPHKKLDSGISVYLRKGTIYEK